MESLEPLDVTPVDESRRVKLVIAAAAVLQRDGVTPLEHQWAREVLDLAVALGQERQLRLGE